MNSNTSSRFIIGIDVGSKKLDLCVYDADENSSQHETASYDTESLDQFLVQHQELEPDNCIVGIESTGDYHLKACKFFLKRDFKVKMINPVLTKKYTDATIRGTKTDRKDAQTISAVIRDNKGDQVSMEEITNQDKSLTRLSTNLKQTVSQLKQRLQSLERRQLNENQQQITETLEQAIEQLENASEQAIEQATETRSQQEKYIESIPGFAIKLSAIVYQEIGDINRFDNVKSLVAYAGLDPRIKQSGSNLDTQGHLTKRGSKYLRCALYLAANVARQYDSDLKAYYEKKKNEGRAHREILCMISRKLLARIYAVLKEERMYVMPEDRED